MTFLIHSLIGVATWVMLALTSYIAFNPAPARYDCSLASFHPDYPAKVRNQCREVRR